MKTISRVFIVALSIAVLSWFLPWLYSFMLPDGGNEPYLAYSPIADRWIVSETNDDKQTEIYDLAADGISKGNIYTKNQRDSLLPQMFYTQLLAREQLDDTICGIEVSPRVFKTTSFVFQSSPRDINKVLAEAYPIMESLPVRIELEDPTDVMLIDSGVKIVDMTTNEEKPKSSARFTKIFADRGFVYPMTDFSANITARKAYDEGYLMVDAEGAVYHVKQQAGRPYMKRIVLPEGVKAKKVFVMENVDHRNLGFIIDTDNHLYVLAAGSYDLTLLPVDLYNPQADRIVVMGNVFNWTIRITNDNGTTWYAINNADYRLLGKYSYSYDESLLAKIEGYIFPYKLSFTSMSDSLAYPRIESVSWLALVLNLILAVVIFVVMRRQRRKALISSVTTIVFGLFSFIPVILLKD